MDKISPVSTSNLLQIYRNNNIVPNQTVTVEASKVSQPVASKEAAQALKAYSGIVPQTKKNQFEKKSLDEYKADLIAQGKVEGKDFEVWQDEMQSKITVIENSRPVKIFRFNKKGESKDDFVAVEIINYPLKQNGLKSIETSYGDDGEFHYRTFKYEKENSPYKNEIVSYGSNPYELQKKLKAEGIQYAQDTDFSDGRMINKTTVFNPKTGDIKRYEFYYGTENNSVGDVAVCFIDKNGLKESEIYFDKNETYFTDFVDNMC